jgi:hypothetical protein
MSPVINGSDIPTQVPDRAGPRKRKGLRGPAREREMLGLVSLHRGQRARPREHPELLA